MQLKKDRIKLYCHTRPQLNNSTQINSVSADELGPPVALFSLTRPSGRPHAKL